MRLLIAFPLLHRRRNKFNRMEEKTNESIRINKENGEEEKKTEMYNMLHGRGSQVNMCVENRSTSSSNPVNN